MKVAGQSCRFDRLPASTQASVCRGNSELARTTRPAGWTGRGGHIQRAWRSPNMRSRSTPMTSVSWSVHGALLRFGEMRILMRPPDPGMGVQDDHRSACQLSSATLSNGRVPVLDWLATERIAPALFCLPAMVQNDDINFFPRAKRYATNGKLAIRRDSCFYPIGLHLVSSIRYASSRSSIPLPNRKSTTFQRIVDHSRTRCCNSYNLFSAANGLRLFTSRPRAIRQ